MSTRAQMMFVWQIGQRAVAVEVQEELLPEAAPHRFFEHVLDDAFAVLLDSAASGSRFSQRSIIALEPEAVLVARSAPPLAAALAHIELHTWGAQRTGSAAHVQRYTARPFDELERLLDARHLPAELRSQLPEGFVGGAIGFAGYDAGRFLERLPEQAARDLDVPELCFLFVDTLLVYEHASGVVRWIASARGDVPEEARARCAARMAALRERFAAPRPVRPGPAAPGPLHAPVDADAYAERVRAAKAQIFAGNVFEVCIAQRLEAAFPRDRGAAWQLYLQLRAESPAPFACCVLTPWACLLSSSPERFLQLTASGWAESRPIKGTRPRGSDAATDEQLRAELASSEKDRAENIMIVDLVRNDLGRVCAVDSIHVPELMIVEEHPSVFQLVSTVRGRLDDDVTPVQLFAACFPPGSMTGAPKIEAMKVIDTLEPVRRGIYAGAVGYFDCGGTLDFSVVIRSFVISDGRCTLSVGGAVVADSDPRAEYLESMDKARAPIAALERMR